MGLAEINWVSVFVGKGMASKNEIARLQCQHVPVRVKGKTVKVKDLWLFQDVEALVRKRRSE